MTVPEDEPQRPGEEGPDHYEGGGVLWCDVEYEHFEFESEDPLKAPGECPHCEAAL